MREELTLRAGATLDQDEPGAVALVHGFARAGLDAPSPAALGLLRGLAAGGVDAATLVTDPALALLATRLEGAGWLARAVRAGDGRLLAVREPLAVGDVLQRRGLEAGVPVRLSRLAMLHAEGGAAVVESGAAKTRVVLHEPRLTALAGLLAVPAAPAQLDPAAVGVTRVELDAVLRLLLQARLLVRLDGTGDPERDQQALAQWTPVDLLFHARSRLGRRGGGFGGTYPFRGRFPEPPALPDQPAPGAGAPIRLPRPDLRGLLTGDPPFAAVHEQRRSIREHDDEHPIDVAQLGELLFRTARVRATLDSEDHGTFALRPYPNGGALYELEISPVVRLCDGLEAGLYRYDAAAHALRSVAADAMAVSGLLEHARVAALMARRPQVLLVISARFERVSFKYEAMPYALTLKHVGVLYQSLYLAATAMGLAPCGLGGGDSDLFARAAGTDYVAETSVGELIVGSRRADDLGPGIEEVARPTPGY